jgi:hypothetical protein
MTDDTFQVIAIIAARNEADVIPQLLDDLARQNVSAYLIDDGSSDDTVARASQWRQRGLLGIEQRPDTGTFEWAEILERKEKLATELPASWFIHQDADEFHESPWPHLDLRDAIRHVDALGYSAINFRLLNFRPTDTDAPVPDDVQASLKYCEPAEAWDVTQIKCWKNTGVRVDLHSSGGHAAEFENRIVCPIEFLTRHYPIRSFGHGLRKVFEDRRLRFSPSERARGWHIQYDGLDASKFVRQASSLTLFDRAVVKKDLMTASRDAARLAQLTMQRDSEVKEYAEELARLRQLNALTQQHLESSRRELAVAQRENQAALSSAEVAWQTSERERAQSDEARRALERGLSTLAAELRAVYGSRSWRMSGPLRAIYGWFLRTRGQYGPRGKSIRR